MNPHDPLRHILQYTGLLNFTDLDYNSLKSHCIQKVTEIKNLYYSNHHEQFDYNDVNNQMAYMIYYFPNYIETINHVLQDVDKSQLIESFKNRMEVCIYGGGPVPELYGFMAFMNESFPEVISIKAHLFDKNNWNAWRQYCIQNMSCDYWDDKDISYIPYFLDLCQFIDPQEIESFQIINKADVHIIQNCGLDLIASLKCPNKFQEIFLNLINSIKKGSIIIIIDVAVFDVPIPGSTKLFDIRGSLQGIQKYVQRNGICSVLKPVSTYSKYEYNPIYIQYEFINREFPTKKFPVKYHALVLKKIEDRLT